MPRYGTTQYIGWAKRPRCRVSAAVVDPSTGRVTKPAKFTEPSRRLECSPELIVALTATEWEQYGRLYEKRLRDKALRRRAAAEYIAQSAPPPADTEPGTDRVPDSEQE